MGELAEMFHAVDRGSVRLIAASGNAVRANPLVRETIERQFGVGCSSSTCQEEAALGAAYAAAIVARLGPPRRPSAAANAWHPPLQRCFSMAANSDSVSRFNDGVSALIHPPMEILSDRRPFQHMPGLPAG